MPEPMRLVQNLSFNMSVGGACSTTSGACTSAPVVLPGRDSSGLTYEMTAAKFQLSGVQLKPFAEEAILTQLDLLNGSSVVLSGATDSTAVTAIALKFQSARAAGSGTFEITGNLVMGAGYDRVVLPLKLSFENQLLAETAVVAQGSMIDGVEFNASTWFDFSDSKSEIGHVFKAITGGACQITDAPNCIKLRDNIARQVSMRISKSMSAKAHTTGKPTPQTKKLP